MGHNTLFEEYRSPLHVQCGRLLLVALVPGVIGMASEHWLAATAPRPAHGEGEGAGAGAGWEDVQHLGLWAVCSNFSRCASLPSADFPDAYEAVRGMGVTSMCLHVLSVLVGLLCSCEDPDTFLGINVYMPRLEETLAVVAGILMGGALGVFVQATKQHPVYHAFRLDWSFWIMLVYVFILLFAGGVIVLVRNQRACRKLLSRLRRCQQSMQCAGICKPKPSEESAASQFTEQDTSTIQTIKETKVFIEKDGQNFKEFVGSPKVPPTERSQFLQRMKELGHVYTSLEGLPRVLQKSSENAGETAIA